MSIKKRGIAIFLFLLIVLIISKIDIVRAVNSLGRTTFAQMVPEDSGDNVLNMSYDEQTDSYKDSGVNENMEIRVYTNDTLLNLEGMYACLTYKVGDKFLVVSVSASGSGQCAELSAESNITINGFDYNYSEIKFYNHLNIDDLKGIYPASLVAVITENDSVEISDTFIKMNASTDGWFIGNDGGDPCFGIGTLWQVNESCSIESDADQKFDSYDIIKGPAEGHVNVTITQAYYPKNGDAQEITDMDKDYAIVGISYPNGTIIDSIITSVVNGSRSGPNPDNDSDDMVQLFHNTTSGLLHIIVNGIKTGEYNATPANTSLNITSLSILASQDDTKKIFEFVILNNGNYTANNISWSFKPGDGVEINTTTNIDSLAVGNRAFVYIEYNYTQRGDYSATASVTDGLSSYEKNITVHIPEVKVSSLTLLYNNSLQRIFGFTISNEISNTLMEVNWTFDTNDNNFISANQFFSLNTSEQAFIFIEYNYSSTGTYNVNATAINGSLKDSVNYTFTIT